MPENELENADASIVDVNPSIIEFIDLDYNMQKFRDEIYRYKRTNIILGKTITDSFQAATNEIHSKYAMHKREKGEYQCILLDHTIFMELMHRVGKICKKRYNRVYPYEYSFVDAGCGVGHKVFLASRLGFEKITGIDIEYQYLSAAKKTIKQFCEDGIVKHYLFKKIKFIEQNILETNYSNFDIIYFYVPLSDHDKEIKFEKKIVETAKSGAIIIGIGNHYINDIKKSGLIKHGSYIFEKK